MASARGMRELYPLERALETGRGPVVEVCRLEPDSPG